MVIIKNYKVKKLFNKFPEISGKIGINFRKFPEIFRGKFLEISELTTLSKARVGNVTGTDLAFLGRQKHT